MALPEQREDFFQGDNDRIKYHQHNLVVPGLPATHFFIAGIGRKATGVSHRSRINTLLLPKKTLSPPETSQANNDLFHIGRERWLKRSFVYSVLVMNGHSLRATG